MEMIPLLTRRLDEIQTEVMGLVDDQSLSLTEKNRKMAPLVDEKRVIEQAAAELKRIADTDYGGQCVPGKP